MPKALEFEQQAYQALLKLQAREYQVSRSQSQSAVIRTELQEVMFSKCGVYRTQELLTEARDAVASLQARARTLRLATRVLSENEVLIRDRIAELQKELDAMHLGRTTQRARRQARQGLARRLSYFVDELVYLETPEPFSVTLESTLPPDPPQYK